MPMSVSLNLMVAVLKLSDLNWESYNLIWYFPRVTLFNQKFLAKKYISY